MSTREPGHQEPPAAAKAIAVRPMQPQDVGDVAALCGELGYPTGAEDVAKRFASIEQHGHGQVYVAATGDGRVIGWIHVFGARTLEAEPCAEIGGLVVADGSRGHGIGVALITAGERWAAGQGFGAMRVRSRVVRERAHRFYERLGYVRFKTQHNFEKVLHRGDVKDVKP